MALMTAEQFKGAVPDSKRLLGFDVGKKTIGLALSDRSRTIATPMRTLARGTFSKDLEILRGIIEDGDIGGLVVGDPVNMNGTRGPRCQSTGRFAENLSAAFHLPVLLWDERLSTAAVERAMLEADLSRSRRAELVDKAAATYILQGALDGLANSGRHSG